MFGNSLPILCYYDLNKGKMKKLWLKVFDKKFAFLILGWKKEKIMQIEYFHIFQATKFTSIVCKLWNFSRDIARRFVVKYQKILHRPENFPGLVFSSDIKCSCLRKERK